MTIRVGIADDQAMIRNGFRLQVQYTDDLELVGEASNGEQAVSLARSQAPDVLLMDVRMPVMDGIEVLRLVARGLSNAELARELTLSPLTTKTHVSRILTKLGLRDRAQLVVAAYESGLVTPGDPPSDVVTP